MLILLASLSVLTPSAAGSSAANAPPLRIWMSGGRRFSEGERVRVQVDADVDGFLLVFNYDTDGRLRVLFPIDPRDDARVSAGRRYELRDDRGESAFRAGGDGTGFIYSAVSRDPWRLDDLTLGTGWDYSRLLVDRDAEDPEAEITDLVQQLAGPAGFDYDVAGYRVYGTVTYSYTDYPVRGPIYVYDDYLYCRSWFWRYNGCHRYPFDGGWSIGFGYYPYDSWYYRYGYGYGYGYGYNPYGYGYYPYYPYNPYGPLVPGGRGPVVTGRPRTYTVHPRPTTGERTVGGTLSGPRGGTGNSVVPPINWRPRSIARPAGGRGPEVTRTTGERTTFVPPARRARPERATYPEPRARAGGSGGGGNVRDYGNRGGSGYAPRARSEPRSSAPPPSSRGAERSGGNGGGNSGAVDIAPGRGGPERFEDLTYETGGDQPPVWRLA